MNVLHILFQYRDAFAGGVWVTIKLFTVATVLGSACGILLGAAYQTAPQIVRKALDFVSFSFAAIPALVILFWLHFPLQEMLGVVIPPFVTAAATLTLLNAIGVSRTVIEAKSEFPQQYLQAALVCGLDRWTTFRHIEMPILLRAVFPRWIDQQVVIYHTTIFASLISVEEIFRVSQRVNSTVYQPVAIYSAMAVLFLITAGSAMALARSLKMRFARNLSEK